MQEKSGPIQWKNHIDKNKKRFYKALNNDPTPFF